MIATVKTTSMYRTVIGKRHKPTTTHQRPEKRGRTTIRTTNDSESNRIDDSFVREDSTSLFQPFQNDSLLCSSTIEQPPSLNIHHVSENCDENTNSIANEFNDNAHTPNNNGTTE